MQSQMTLLFGNISMLQEWIFSVFIQLDYVSFLTLANGLMTVLTPITGSSVSVDSVISTILTVDVKTGLYVDALTPSANRMVVVGVSYVTNWGLVVGFAASRTFLDENTDMNKQIVNEM
jgi:hypothetical protein